jgi:hypothetical protein
MKQQNNPESADRPDDGGAKTLELGRIEMKKNSFQKPQSPKKQLPTCFIVEQSSQPREQVTKPPNSRAKIRAPPTIAASGKQFI